MARQVVFATLCFATAALLPTQRTRTPSLLYAKKTVWTFDEARDYARSFGFGSKDEYVEYRCPGAYALPRDPVAAFGDRWTSWWGPVWKSTSLSGVRGEEPASPRHRAGVASMA